MNITELKELAEKATPGPWLAGDDEDSDYFLVGPCGDDGIVYQSVVKLHSETNADYIAAANPAEILELIAKLEDAQGEIRALRATEAGLRERIAAVEADRAQRVPDGWKLVPIEPTDAMVQQSMHLDLSYMPGHEGPDRVAVYRAMLSAVPLLASTPAPAQQEPAKPMDAHRAAYFMRRFLHEEKMLGPNEQAALHFTIAALEAMESAAQHQEPPQQERKPMTDEQAVKCIEAAGFRTWTSAHFRLVRQAERHHGIKE